MNKTVETVRERQIQHNWSSLGRAAMYCSCGQDTVTCQGCGRQVCGEVAIYRENPATGPKGNIGVCCFAKFGLGHSGTDAR